MPLIIGSQLAPGYGDDQAEMTLNIDVLVQFSPSGRAAGQ